MTMKPIRLSLVRPPSGGAFSKFEREDFEITVDEFGEAKIRKARSPQVSKDTSVLSDFKMTLEVEVAP